MVSKLSIEQAEEWLSDDPTYINVLFPFVGGNEVNKTAECKPSTWVISFWDWPEEKAAGYSKAFATVKDRVRPYVGRMAQKDKGAQTNWWNYLRPRPELYHLIGRGSAFDNHPADWNSASKLLKRVMVISTGVTKYPAFTFVPPTSSYSHKLCVLADERFSVFAMLTSDVHGVWAWAQKTSMGGDLHSLVYAHGNIFETFPFPAGLLDNGDDELEKLGERFFHLRQSFMETHNKGLTKFYNEFHDLEKSDGELEDLRRIQGELNQLVCLRYGWNELDLACGFHEVGYLPDGKNIRFTISEEARRDVLLRLSKMNKVQFEEDKQLGHVTKRTGVEADPESDASISDDLFDR